jgi:DNA-binding PadR family transcriptional regulator
MNLHDDDFETRVRRALLAEAERIDLPATVWPRLEARLAQARAQTFHGPLFEDIDRKNSLRELILALLTDQEMDHYTLVQQLDALSSKADPRSGGTGGGLPLLHQLEREGLLSARWQPTSRGVRRMYRAAQRGHRVRSWVRAARRLARLAAWARPSSARGAPNTEGAKDR